MRLYPALLFFVLLFSGITLRAQDPMTFAYRPHWPDHFSQQQHAVSFSGEYMAASDALTNSFLNAFYKGEYLDSSMKAKQESYLLPKNRLGAYAGYGFAYTWRNNPDSLKWELTVAVRDRQEMFGAFASDAFRLAFEGNRPFRGTTANLDKSQLTYMHWQQLQFEGKYYTSDHKSEVVLGFSVLSGQQLQEVNIREGKLYTASDGRSIDLTSNATYYASDTSSNKMFNRAGFGTCFNFRFSTMLGDSTSRFHHQLMFSVQDLGSIRWSNRALIYNVDTTVHYNGVDASDVLINHGEVTGLPNSDSLIGQPDEGQIITFLPIGIRARYTLFTPTNWWGGVDLRFWSYSGALPQATLFAGWHSNDEKWSATGGAGWGGFARLQFPVQLTWNACRDFAVTAGTTNLAGYIIPGKTRGQGLYMNLSFAF